MEQSQLAKENSSRNLIQKFKVPPFESRFKDKVKINQFYSHPLTKQWVQTVFEFSGMSESAFSKVDSTFLIIATFYSFCEDIKRFETLVKFVMTTFVCDDISETRDQLRGQKLWNEMSLACDKIKNRDSSISMTDWNVCTVFAFSLKEQICEQFNETQIKRMIELLKEHYDYQIIENTKIEEGLNNISFDQLKQLRIESSGSKITIDLIEYGDNIAMSEEEWSGTLFQKFLTLCAECICYTNDVYSFEKEYQEHKGNIKKMLNVVSQMVILEKLDIEVAMIKALEQLKAIESECEECANTIINDPNVSQTLKTFVDHALFAVGGNYYGHSTHKIKRYLGVE